MTHAYSGSPAELIQTAKNAMAVQGELEGYLKSWMGLRDEFAGYVKNSATAAAIQSTMDTAHTSGITLAHALQDIIDALKDTGNKIDSTDLENQARVLGAIELGTNGKVDTGSW